MRRGDHQTKAIKNNGQHTKYKNDGGLTERRKAESRTNQTCSKGEKECFNRTKTNEQRSRSEKTLPFSLSANPNSNNYDKNIAVFICLLFCWRKFRYLPDQFFRIIKPKYTFLDLAVYFSVVRLSKSALYIYIHKCTYNF